MAKLTDKQEMFCQEYLVDLNATAAYQRAGYTAGGGAARANASRLLTNANVQERISELMSERSERTKVTADRVVKELARLAFTDMRSFVKWGPEGVKLLDSEELSPDDSAAVTEVSESFSENGKTLRFKLGYKDSALRQLAQHVGIAEKGAGVNVNVNVDARRESKESEFERLFSRIDEYRAGLPERDSGSDTRKSMDTELSNNQTA